MLGFHSIIKSVIEYSYKSDRPGDRYTSFLELGVSSNRSLICNVDVPRCVGVEIRHLNEMPNHVEMHYMKTDEFFEQNEETFDCIFIDADHGYTQVIKDLDNSLKVLNPGGTIFLHDTDPYNRSLEHPSLCHNSYLVARDLMSLDKYKHLNVITLPIESTGLTIVNRAAEARVNKWRR